MLKEYLNRELILPHLNGADKTAVLDELAYEIVCKNAGLKKDVVASSLTEREALGTTAIENGFAIPHAKIGDIKKLVIAIGRSKEGIDFGAEDGTCTNLFFAMLAPIGSAGEHLKVLARLTKILTIKNIKEKLLSAESANDIYNLLVEADEKLC